MTWAWAFLAMAWGGPKAIVAVGDGLVAVEPGPASAPAPGTAASASDPAEKGADAEIPIPTAPPTVAGGWVAVLADCLEERRPHQYALLDRTADGWSPSDARLHVGEVREMAPALVIVGVGLPGDADRDGLRVDLAGLVEDLSTSGGPHVLLVGPVPTSEEGEPERRVQSWNDDVARIASGGGASHLDLVLGWPASGEERVGLTVSGRQLSDQGHARVGAQVCDAVLAWEAAL